MSCCPTSSQLKCSQWQVLSRPLTHGLRGTAFRQRSSGQACRHRVSACSVESRAVPESPPEWTPPSQPGQPASPPEFTPPSEPGSTPRPSPEFVPPEQNPPTQPSREDAPMRPIRPDTEPQIPDPETPFADPVRTPERRKEISEPAREAPERPPDAPEPERES